MSIFKKIFGGEKGAEHEVPATESVPTNKPQEGESTAHEKPVPTDTQTLVHAGKLPRTKVMRYNRKIQQAKRKQKSTKKLSSQAPKPSDRINVFDTIIRPRITEKAATLNERNVYTFVVRKDATKQRVADAIEALYQVRPKRVSIASIPKKPKRMRVPGKERQHGLTGKGKKAYVYLKDGDSIQLT